MEPARDIFKPTIPIKGSEQPTLTGLPDELLRLIIEMIFSSNIIKNKEPEIKAAVNLSATCRRLKALVGEFISSAITTQNTIRTHLGPHAIPLSAHNLLPPKHPSYPFLSLALYPLSIKTLVSLQAKTKKNGYKISTHPEAIERANTAIALGQDDPFHALSLTPLVTPPASTQIVTAAGGNPLTLLLASVNHNQPVLLHAACEAQEFSQQTRLAILKALEKQEKPNTALGLANIGSDHDPRKALEDLAYLHLRAQEGYEDNARADIAKESVLSLAHKLSAKDWEKAFSFYTKPSDKELLKDLLNALATCYRDFTTEAEQANIKKGLERVIRDELLVSEMTLTHIIQTFLTREEIQDILHSIQQGYEESESGYMYSEVIQPFALAQGLLNPPIQD